MSQRLLVYGANHYAYTQITQPHKQLVFDHEHNGPRLKTLGREDQQIIKCRPWIVRSAARMAECRASRKAVRKAYRSASHRPLT